MTAQSAADPTGAAEPLAPDATWQGTEPPSAATNSAVLRRQQQTDELEQLRQAVRDAESGSTGGANGSDSSPLTSGSSGRPASDSNKRWPKPRHVRALAAQVNEVATMVLNGAIDVEKARLYANLTRTLAQTISAETTRARFAKEAPDLSLETEE